MADTSESDIFPEPTIFANKDLLDISHLPSEDQIIGRDEQIGKLGQALAPALYGNSPNNVLVYGKTGTGKSLCSKFIARQLVTRAEESDEQISAGFAYVNCLQFSTETQAVRRTARDLLDSVDDPEVSIPSKGISVSAYYNRLWTLLDEHYDAAIVILDEVDKLDDDNILTQFSRASEAGSIEDAKLGIIGISNKIGYKDSLSERIKSSLCERELIFPVYDADQLQSILQSRSSAFKNGVLNDDVIPLVAAVAAKEHGDARKAIDVLRFAGEIAQENDDDEVRIEHVYDADREEGKERIRELIEGTSPHSQRLLRSLALLTQSSSEADPAIPNEDVYEFYRDLSERNSYETLKKRRVRDLLNELEFLDLIEQETESRGRAEGLRVVNRLLHEPGLVVDACSTEE